MLLTQEHPDVEKIAVFLDGKRCISFTSANDEEGWIEFPDIAAMAPLDLSQSEEKIQEQPKVRDKLIIKRKKGKVVFKKVEELKVVA